MWQNHNPSLTFTKSYNLPLASNHIKGSGELKKKKNKKKTPTNKNVLTPNCHENCKEDSPSIIKQMCNLNKKINTSGKNNTATSSFAPNNPRVHNWWQKLKAKHSNKQSY